MDYYPDNHVSSAGIMILVFLLTILMIPFTAGADTAAVHAAEQAQDNKVISLRFTVENEPVTGASFTCRRAGTYSDFPEVRKGTVEQVLEDIAKEDAEAANSSVRTGTAGESGQSSAQAAGSRFCLTGKTDTNGELQFFGLPEGVYVIEGGDVQVSHYICTPQPFLMSARDPDREEPVTAQIKYERTDMDPQKPVPENTGKTVPKSSKKLPQTGLAWNRILMMCGAGLMLITAGSALRTPRKKQPDRPVQ